LEKKNRLKKFKLFDMNRDGKGIDPGEDRTPNLKFFFKQFGRKFSKILSLNMLMIFQILPIIAAVFIYLFVTPTTPTHVHPEYTVLYGMDFASSSATTSTNLGAFSYQLGIPEYGTGVYWAIGILIGILVLTYGWQKVASVYITRGLVRGDSVFILSDFFYAIKKNFRQGFFFGLIDCLIMFILGFNLIFFLNSPPTMRNVIMQGTTLALICIYIVMRFYIYLMLVTFNIKIFKAMKNALIFTILGIKRNLLACLGLIIVTAIAVVPMLLLLPKFGVALVLPLIYYLGTCSFIYTYAAYPVVKKYMIDPIPENNPPKSNDYDSEDITDEVEQVEAIENEAETEN